MQVNATAIRAEQAKQGRNMRIQNKAKFVSKRIKDSHGGDQDEVDLSAVHGASGNGKISAPQASLLLPSLSVVSEHVETGVAVAEALLPQAVVNEIMAMTSEAELRELQKQVMIEKRKLRLEQRQTDGPMSVDCTSEADRKVSELTAKESVILEQIEKVLHRDKEEPQLGGDDERNVASLGQLSEPLPASPLLKKTDSSASIVSRKSLSSRYGAAVSAHGDVFEQAEALLQAVKSVISDSPSRPGDSMHSLKGGHHGQPIILLELKISELMKRMPQQSNMDPLGFKDKLRGALLELEKIRHMKEDSHKYKFEKKQLPKQHDIAAGEMI